MKHVFLMMLTMMLAIACVKEGNPPISSIDYSRAVYLTPNGKVIPYSEKDNWKAFEKAHFTEEKADAKRFGSFECTTPEIKCGTECRKDKTKSDCIRANECAPCYGCPCTPIVNPYE